MLQPSPQSSSRYPSERRGRGEKKEKKKRQRGKTGAFFVKALGKTRSYS